MKGYPVIIRGFAAIMLIAFFIISAELAQGQETAIQPGGRNMAEMQFSTVPGLPTCAPVSVQSGNPAKGPSIILIKVAADCSIPWHWHTPNEHVMMVSGVRMDIKGGESLILQAGGFAMMPSHHVHQFRAIQPCVFFLYSDKSFDIHYVDGQGKEISPAEALKRVNETTVSK